MAAPIGAISEASSATMGNLGILNNREMRVLMSEKMRRTVLQKLDGSEPMAAKNLHIRTSS